MKVTIVSWDTLTLAFSSPNASYFATPNLGFIRGPVSSILDIMGNIAAAVQISRAGGLI
jgi:hypothetical protein